MRYLVLSDLHANLPALDAVLKHARPRGYDDVMFLGDAVGYYPHAEEVVQRLIDLNPSVRVLGNHDSALLELAYGERGEYWAAGVVMEVIDRQLTTLSSDSIAFLYGPPLRTWQEQGAIPRRAKQAAYVGLAISVLICSLVLHERPIVLAMVLAFLGGSALFIALRPEPVVVLARGEPAEAPPPSDPGDP